MKRLTKIVYLNIALLLLVGMLVGCAGKTNEGSTNDSSENSSIIKSTEKDTSKTDTDDTNKTAPGESVDNSGSKASGKEGQETLSQYSSEQIEYARVWLQLGANQDIDELNVRPIPAGTPLNANDNTSASYPEDVIQLAGSRLVDGSVTYSGNGDGTINVYKVPLRWDGKYPAGKKIYTDIINNTELVYVDPGDDEKIIELIKLLNVH